MLSVNQSRKIPPALIALGQKQMDVLLNTVNGIGFVMLCSSDGFELALASKRNLENNSKIAAVSSSILAMVTAFISEIHLHGCNSITLDAANGKVLLTAVEHPQHPMVIVALASNDILLGQFLFQIKRAAENLASS